MGPNQTREPLDRVWLTLWTLTQLMTLGVFWTGMRPIDAAVCVGLYYGRMFFITGGFHRYFAHRTYKLNRFWQFAFAFCAQTAAQRGALWWAAHHRHHHRFSDLPEDTHSPLHGFWHSHAGWIFYKRNHETRTENIKDFAKYPELRFLDRFHLIPAIALGALCFWLGGASMLFGGFFLSTTLLYHGTFTINSLSHTFGTRRFATMDTSRNNFLLALITMGEGWHNNHHHYLNACRQGFVWWEIDLTWYGLKFLSWLGIVREMKGVPESVMKRSLLKDTVIDMGMFQAYWSKAAQALGDRRAATGAYCENRKHAVQTLIRSTKEKAEEIASMPPTVDSPKI